jgi:hypothetical protein
VTISSTIAKPNGTRIRLLIFSLPVFAILLFFVISTLNNQHHTPERIYVVFSALKKQSQHEYIGKNISEGD